MKLVKLKYKDGFIGDIVPGTSLYDISLMVQDNFEFSIIGAKLNNIYVDLSTKVMGNGTLEFYDRSSFIGNRLYGRTLEFLIITAAKEVLKEDTDVHINYSLDNGMYCEVSNQNVTSNLVIKLEERIKQFIKEDIVITKSKVDRLDAIKYFTKTKQFDKVKNLNYTVNSVVDLYKLKNTYDYFFGPLAHSTGQINKFKLTYLSSNSFIASYPTTTNPSVVNKYNHPEKLFKKYKEFEKWGYLIDVNAVADLNNLGAMGKYTEAIRLFETHFESQLSSVADKISSKKKIKAILISGPSSSGKTTTTRKLGIYLKARGINCHYISMDDYLVNEDKKPKDEFGRYDYANIKSTDIALFNNHLKKLLKGERVRLPKYDFVKGKRLLSDRVIELKEDDVLLVEGVHALNSIVAKDIPDDEKFRVFVTPIIQIKIDNHNRIRTTDLRKLRRIVRDNRNRGKTAEETLEMWYNVDKEAKESIYPYENDADEIINSSLSYEIGVLRIFAEPLLYGIKSTSPVYSEALRLINILRQFMPISSESVPKESILREFIGEGAFN